MKAIGVIPARWASTRLEGKVLAEIAGKPMIQHVWERASEAKNCSEVLIACDEEHVLKRCQEFGAKAVLTSPDCPTGTDRIVEAVKDLDVDIAVNIQGDEPLIHSEDIDKLVLALKEERQAVMATVAIKLEDEASYNNPNVVKVVLNTQGHALYFSRANIPFNRDNIGFDKFSVYKHLGLYAYRKDFLAKFSELPQGKLEAIECLEQLRVLEAGHTIKVIETAHDSIGVDTQEDLQRVEELIQQNG